MILRFLFVFFASISVLCAAPEVTIPTVNLSLSAPDTPNQLVTTLNIIIVLTILALAPSIVFMMTSFLRLLVVFSFLRQAMGTQSMPPGTVLTSLALILTFFIMEPVATKAYNDGVKPYLAEEIGYEQAFELGSKPFKNFMLRNTRDKDIALFYRIRDLPNPQSVDDVPLTVLVPAFMVSELKTAFEISFLIYLPFLVIDMVVASVLMAMGMMMLPPSMISLPFKLLIFVLVDGWHLLVQRLVESFSVVV
ncbi:MULTISPECIES: flagellar type III secretion system pore protein FliP [unclassified Campylobacter]|uniref:flagellar type III secretion system pore protein FliP n=1 Tax=unclassified Campylobacter TaxID=2593542 RepID=UPI001237DF14|nr:MULTISPECIES: flagellar type III secretion system pore protein FliP [unclassified Campylobacter]KAA6224974.1 flagellar type III secretion system pore protein FliP [Campylobacter sp. LR196d]KAA6225296.1 flagellar type III secretion system pore protein FliP [Campylobacter sp. LR286c]KAA6225585.1 flagellar type III secretion system pore protein FliP [Campylobacter sp. LR185c]KAA6230421.1 flagellar type III secretion system pore protein FliP [Campylobacter sp. LR291e]KAA6230553.1 flagellar type